MEKSFPHRGKNQPAISPWQIGVRSARANLVPGLVLQALAIAFVGAYYFWPAFHGWLQVLVDWQNRGGVVFSIGTRMVFNGVIPAIFTALIPELRLRRPWAGLVFGLIWWGFMGANTHWFYTGQAYLWGTAADWRTVILKTATDMLVYSPFYASPLVALAHLWQGQNYSFRATRVLLGRGWYRRLVLPNTVSGWAFWTPCLLVLYALPTALQMPLSAILGSFWALMCLQIARRTPAS
ncbi:MAG TPA: hypothetical protein P5169_04555 [Kiritimatiellia bacterium]|nr:hypothetical protein [Kiritimatiellia bacterium]